jgi:hypothetical protein
LTENRDSAQLTKYPNVRIGVIGQAGAGGVQWQPLDGDDN